MSQENVEIVRALFERLQQLMDQDEWSDEAYPPGLADDLEWVTAPEMPGPTRYRGREGLREFMRTWMEDFDAGPSGPSG